MDDIVSGYSTYHGAATGNDYKLSNTGPYKWADDSTGRIISTPTNIRPAGVAIAPCLELHRNSARVSSCTPA